MKITADTSVDRSVTRNNARSFSGSSFANKRVISGHTEFINVASTCLIEFVTVRMAENSTTGTAPRVTPTISNTP